jgi:PAS domain S-box-containing protein
LDYRLEDVRLSDRERTVLLLAADGLTDKEIALSLGLSLKTVHTYWDRMRQKFNANTRTQIFAKFLRVNVDAASSEGGLKSLFATWEEGVWIVGPTGRTIDANQRIAKTFGYTLEEFPKHTVPEVLARSGAPEVGQQLLDLQRGGQTFEAAIQTQDGQRYWLSLKGAPIPDEKGGLQALSILVRDVTVEKRVVHALHSCEAVLASLTDLSSDCIAKFDSNLHCVYVNPSFVALLDQPAHNIVGQHVRHLEEVFSPNPTWVEALDRALRTAEVQQFVAPATGVKPDFHTWLLPEPSVDLQPKSILSITRCA